MRSSKQLRLKESNDPDSAALFLEVQQPLFEEFPEQPALVQKVKEFIHSGAIVAKDAELCARVVRAFLAGVSKRKIARHFQIGRESIDAIMEAMEASGKLRPLKERLAAGWAQIALESQEAMLEMLDRGEVPANVAFLMGATATDKMLLLTGQATEIVEHKKGPEISIEELNRRVEALPRVGPLVAAIDVQSTGNDQKP